METISFPILISTLGRFNRTNRKKSVIYTLNDFARSSNLKCSEQTSVPAAIVYSLPSSQRIPWIHYFPVDADVGQFLSLLLAFKNTKTKRHSEIKQTRPSTKQDFSGEALSKQNTEASLASLSWNSSRAMTEWSAIFAFGVCLRFWRLMKLPWLCASRVIVLSRPKLGFPTFRLSYKPGLGRIFISVFLSFKS